MIDEHLSQALVEALDLLEANGITDHWRPLDGALGQEIRAVVAEAVEAAEEGEPLRFEDIAQWGEDYGPDMLNTMIAALEAARRIYTERAKTLAQALAIARTGSETALDLLSPETRRALVRRIGYGPALKLCEDEKRAALATAQTMKAAMKTGEPSRPFAVFRRAAPPLRKRKRGGKG